MDGKLLWTPAESTIANANLTRYTDWLNKERGISVNFYDELWKWSIKEIEEFWKSIWDYFEIRSKTPYTYILKERKMPDAKWFEGSRPNFAEHIFRNRSNDAVAIICANEDGDRIKITWSELRRKTASLALHFRELGVTSGDRVAAYLPNSSEAVIGFLAAASIGAIWTCCSPDFGSRGVIDRFKQIEPKILITKEYFVYKGRKIDKRQTIDEIRSSIPSLSTTILLGDGNEDPVRRVERWNNIRIGHQLEFESVPFEHPLWILYSSGTTGPPKPIVHSHGGILLEHFKALSFHNNISKGERMFWYTSTGWMMWNFLVGSLLLGSTIVLYDGDPVYPDANVLWNLVDELGINFFGSSAAYVHSIMKNALDPKSTHDLRTLKGFGSTGSALSPAGFEWLYRHVSDDLWVASMSGGTDICSILVGGCPVLPVRSGRIQCRCLGASVFAFDESGKAVDNQMGELVITQPLPSMPLYLWGDTNSVRYKESYFSTFPGRWRHGDWIQLFSDGSCILYGRSDATIKKSGIRGGTSELYGAVESIPEVQDSIVLDLEFYGGQSYMPMFVVLSAGRRLDELLENTIKQKIRKDVSPRLVPDEIIQIQEMPLTLNGKKMEVPIRKILLGFDPSKAFDEGSIRNPKAMDFFLEFATKMHERRKDQTNEQ